MIFVPILKVVSGWCNIDCTYCHYHECPLVRNRQVMSSVVLRRIISSTLAANPQRADFIWHGGECTLAGIRFFERVLALEQELKTTDQRVRNYVQTNGITMSDQWASFFAKNAFQVGVSLDGPQDLHDRYRVFRSGAGTFCHVMRAVECLRRHKVDFGVLAVVTKESVEEPDRMFDFFVENGFMRFGLNPMVGLDPNDPSCLHPAAAHPTVYARFLCRIFDRWLALDNPDLRIREIHAIVRSMMGGSPSLCAFSGRCEKYFTIDAEGGVYSCDGEACEESLKIGSLMTDEVASIIHGQKSRLHREHVTRAQQRQGCTLCEWSSICHGGCTKDYYLGETSDGRMNAHCGAYRTILFPHIADRLRHSGARVVGGLNP